jgi:hypothetical protein
VTKAKLAKLVVSPDEKLSVDFGNLYWRGRYRCSLVFFIAGFYVNRLLTVIV